MKNNVKILSNIESGEYMAVAFTQNVRNPLGDISSIAESLSYAGLKTGKALIDNILTRGNAEGRFYECNMVNGLAFDVKPIRIHRKDSLRKTIAKFLSGGECLERSALTSV